DALRARLVQVRQSGRGPSLRHLWLGVGVDVAEQFLEPDLQARGLLLQVTLGVRPDALGRPLLNRLGDGDAAPIGIADPDAARHGDSPSWFAGMSRVAVVFIYTRTRTSCLRQKLRGLSLGSDAHGPVLALWSPETRQSDSFFTRFCFLDLDSLT